MNKNKVYIYSIHTIYCNNVPIINTTAINNVDELVNLLNTEYNSAPTQSNKYKSDSNNDDLKDKNILCNNAYLTFSFLVTHKQISTIVNSLNIAHMVKHKSKPIDRIITI